MDEHHYNNLFKFFCVVANRTNPSLASDEDLCREIFHERVLFPDRVKSVENAVERIKGKGHLFKTAKNYKNWLYTVFRNAINEHLRSEHRRKKRIQEIPSEQFHQLPDPANGGYGEDEQKLEMLARNLAKNFSREEKLLLALRYIQSRTQEQAGKQMKVSTSTISRRESDIKSRLYREIEKKGQKLEEEHKIYVLGILLRHIEKEIGDVKWSMIS